MSTQAQIDADAELALRLHEEELARAAGGPQAIFPDMPFPIERPTQPNSSWMDTNMETLFRNLSPMTDQNDPFDSFSGLSDLSPQFPGRGYVVGRGTPQSGNNSPPHGSEQQQNLPPRRASPLSFFEILSQSQRRGTRPPASQPQGQPGSHRTPETLPQQAPRSHDGLADMFNMILSVMDPTNPTRAGQAMGSLGTDSVPGFFRAFIGSMDEGDMPSTYEDWISMAERVGNVNRGATDQEIDVLPEQQFHQTSKGRTASSAGPSSGASGSASTQDDDKCAICLAEYEEGDSVKRLPCTHLFHSECVSKWLKVNKICPCCKQSIRQEGSNS